MKRPLAILLMLGFTLFSSQQALACRCAQRPLADYFNSADVVALGTLESSRQRGDQRELVFTIQENAFKGKLRQGDNGHFLSTADSASCGIDPIPGTVYVLFGIADPTAHDQLRIDGCSGTRPLNGDDSGVTGGFVDVPVRFVISQLAALQGLDILAEFSANMPMPEEITNSALIGLLDITPLAHGGIVPLYAEPDFNAEVLATIDEISQLFNREASYEFPAAEVYARTEFGYRLRLQDGRFGWIASRDSGTWFPYETLVSQRLSYAVEGWSGMLWPGPGAGLPNRLGNHHGERVAATVLESATIGGSLWFRLEVLSSDGCNGENPETRLSGWTPAYLPSGEPLIWYYSRGC